MSRAKNLAFLRRSATRYVGFRGQGSAKTRDSPRRRARRHGQLATDHELIHQLVKDRASGFGACRLPACGRIGVPIERAFPVYCLRSRSTCFCSTEPLAWKVSAPVARTDPCGWYDATRASHRTPRGQPKVRISGPQKSLLFTKMRNSVIIKPRVFAKKRNSMLVSG